MLLGNRLLNKNAYDVSLFVGYKAPMIYEYPSGSEQGIDIAVSEAKHIFAVKEIGSVSFQIEVEERDSFYEIMDGHLPENSMDSEDLFSIAIKELPATGFAQYF